MNYAVVDLPVLSNAEQCADACMRLKAEYLYQPEQYNKIKFQDVNGKSLRYSGGASREIFYRYLRRLYGVARTFSLCREMQPPLLADIHPVTSLSTLKMVDFLVMRSSLSPSIRMGKSLSPRRRQYTGSRHSPHPQLRKPISSSWFISDGNEKRFLLSITPFKATDLRHY